MKTTTKLMFILLTIFLGLMACKKNSASEEELKSSALVAVQRLKAYAGHNRIALSFVIDRESIDSCEIKWGGLDKSLWVYAEEAVNDTISVVIDELQEGNYSFDVLAYGSSKSTGNGMVMRTSAKSYGETYITNLMERRVSDILFVGTSDPYIQWGSSTSKALGVEVKYEDKNNKNRTVFFDRNQQISVLPDYKAGTAISYRTVYLPEQNCIDTFYTVQTDITTPVYYSSLSAKDIVEKSGLVANIVSQTSSFLHDDVEYTNLQFINVQQNPLSVFVVKADLSKGNVMVNGLLPNNGTALGLQTVKAMAKSRDDAGGGVLAAINADFFIGNVPWGPVITQGNIVKTAANVEGTTYFAVARDGKPEIGYFNAGLIFGDYKEMVGGGAHWLVTNGVNGRWGGDTREPRTAVGYSQDKSTVYFVIVDGRRIGYSVGVELTDMAAVMKSLGAHQAINLDGGGSSTLVSEQDGTLSEANRYSDASPRSVANALAIVHK